MINKIVFLTSVAGTGLVTGARSLLNGTDLHHVTNSHRIFNKIFYHHDTIYGNALVADCFLGVGAVYRAYGYARTDIGSVIMPHAEAFFWFLIDKDAKKLSGHYRLWKYGAQLRTYLAEPGVEHLKNFFQTSTIAFDLWQKILFANKHYYGLRVTIVYLNKDVKNSAPRIDVAVNYQKS